MTCSPDNLKLDCLPPETRSAFRACMEIDLLRSAGWYLAGGTALALQAGHRGSVDLDFFTTAEDLSVRDLEDILSSAGHWTTTLADRGTLYGTLNGAKISFIVNPNFTPSQAKIACGAIRILLPDDIAVMKLVAISQRGKKRDFVDLYWYIAVNGAQIPDLFRRVLQQYSKKQSLPHLLKSLTYFDDAEDDVMPALYFETDWARIKAYFKKKTPRAAKTVLGLE